MTRSALLVLILLLSSCASFDKTNILPGQRVPGLDFSFSVPTDKAWFSVIYGTSHRIKLSQLNQEDSYAIKVTLNRGPRGGMYQNAEAHLEALQTYKQYEPPVAGFRRQQSETNIDTQYGELCVRYSSSGIDWRGRYNMGPALVDSISLSCAHPGLKNVLITFEIARRYETDAEVVDLSGYADELFSSVEYDNID